jgi:DNA-binding winged helix-turn-helix (wHTH) protein
MQTDQSAMLRFGPFEVDVGAGELRKQGRRIKLQEQPLQVLLALLERPGDLITRHELHRRLWPNGTFVGFEDGLNTAVMRLRSALADRAARPRYIETRPRRGYRFIGQVDRAAAGTGMATLRSIAVLPLENLSGNPDDEVFADAMTDELITSLANHSSLRVISRTSAMQFKRSHRPFSKSGDRSGSTRWSKGRCFGWDIACG